MLATFGPRVNWVAFAVLKKNVYFALFNLFNETKNIFNCQFVDVGGGVVGEQARWKDESHFL